MEVETEDRMLGAGGGANGMYRCCMSQPHGSPHLTQQSVRPVRRPCDSSPCMTWQREATLLRHEIFKTTSLGVIDFYMLRLITAQTVQWRVCDRHSVTFSQRCIWQPPSCRKRGHGPLCTTSPNDIASSYIGHISCQSVYTWRAVSIFRVKGKTALVHVTKL
jgi:hypothetical protein